MKTKKEIKFSKYQSRGSDYHYQQINKRRFRKFNSFVLARYMIHIRIIEEFIKKFEFKRKLRIVDFGCGDGVLLYLIQQHFKKIDFEIYGIDTSKEALEIANKKLKGVFKESGVYDTGFESDLFDIVISSDVIEHVKDAELMVREMRRVAREGALVIVGTPIRITEEPQDKMHIHEFYPKEFISLFKKHLSFLDLRKSHSLLCYLLYEKQFKIFWKKLCVFRYLMNISTYLGYNFFEKYKSKRDRYVYMFIVCAKS